MAGGSLRWWLLVVASFAGSTPGPALASKTPPEARVVRNLHAFVKLYGYVRWFHPSDEAAALDWDRFAVIGARRLRDVTDDAALGKALEDLFVPIAPTLQIYDRTQKPRDVTGFFAGSGEGAPVVAWQHLGVASRALKTIYRSVRLNRTVPADSTSPAFGPIHQSVDAVPLRGKTVRLRAALRARVASGQGSGALWLRVDRERGRPGLFDDMSDRRVVRDEWTEAEIVGVVDADAEEMYVGAFLMGRGIVDVDDVRLEVKNGAG